MAQKETSFIAGLIGGVGQTMLDKQREKKAQKLKTLQVLIDNPDVDDESRQAAVDELVGMSGLSPKGKGSEKFHRARGMIEGILKITKGITGARGKMQGQPQDQGSAGGEELGMPTGTNISPEGTEIGPMPERGAAEIGQGPSTHYPQGFRKGEVPYYGGREYNVKFPPGYKLKPGIGPAEASAEGGGVDTETYPPVHEQGGLGPVQGSLGAVPSRPTAGRAPVTSAQAGGQSSLGQLPQRGRSPYRLKTTAQRQAEEISGLAQRKGVEQYFSEEEKTRERSFEASDRERRAGLAKEYGITGAAAIEFQETGKIPAGLMGKVQQGKDAYENPPGSGHFVRDIIDTQSGQVVGQVPAQSPVKPSKFDQYADALIKSGKAKDPEQAYTMATDQVYDETKAKIADINSKISARAASVASKKAGLQDLTKAEKAEIDSLKTEMQVAGRRLDREKAAQAKEATTDRKKSHDEEINRLVKEIDDITAEISSKLSTVKSRSGIGEVPGRLPKGEGKDLTDRATAQKFLDAARGDPRKAQQLAEQSGWKVPTRQ